MSSSKHITVDSPIGNRATDSVGSPVGVVRMDATRSYPGIGELLRQFINESSDAAWQEIRAKIDYTHNSLDLVLGSLEAESRFSAEIRSRVEKGPKLLFKPNLVNVHNIDSETHGPGVGSTTCTEWAFVAALMRWFHDKLGISYHQMALGEAATAMSSAAGLYSMLNPEGKPVTTEAVMEGKAGDFYGGWGFYFARKYLAESLEPGRTDDPMKGYEESVSGTYIPPGQVSDKLMVYDLNRIFDDSTKGRDIKVPGGVNFDSIILHKVVVGGTPDDPGDLEAYPGCVLVNVPKLKVHIYTLFTNVIKNLGIGLYPMQAARAGGYEWDYGVPHVAVPGMKGGIPHQVWVAELDPETGLPERDADGTYIVSKTGGITATMIDIIRAVSSQGIFMVHVVDAIEAINLDHQGILPGLKVPEGLAFAGVDPVATDFLCARYMFSNVPMDEAERVALDDGAGGHFPQRVPVPRVEGNDIVTGTGYDCPLARDSSCPETAEKRGLGERRYYAVGRDSVADCPLASLQGRLGAVSEGRFSELVTDTLYYDAFKFPWDMQQTSSNYLAAVDELAGSSLKSTFLEAFDENGDGIVTLEEFGKTGLAGPLLRWAGESVSRLGTELLGYLHGPFTTTARMLKCSRAPWNPDGHDFLREYRYVGACVTAYRMSQMDFEAPDAFLPGLTWGKGKWPSFELASYVNVGMSVFGAQFPSSIMPASLYGNAFRYADLTQNGGRYAAGTLSSPDSEGIDRYISEVLSGKEKPLDFVFYVPAGYENIGGSTVPNVEVTADPGRIFTASFGGGKEIW